MCWQNDRITLHSSRSLSCMKKSALTILPLFLGIAVWAQTETIPWKKPVDEQNRVGDISAFRVGKNGEPITTGLKRLLPDLKKGKIIKSGLIRNRK